MSSTYLPLHEGLHSGSRLRRLTSSDDRLCLAEMALLGAAGVSAAVASQIVDLHLQIPGHAILKAVFPIVLGLALVPRRGAGTVMGLSALSATLLFHFWRLPGGRMSLGALTSLLLIGPLLDFSLRKANRGWRLYVGFAMAGLAANFGAFVIRAAAKLVGFEHLGTKPFPLWMQQAVVTYTVFGLIAGTVSGLILFHGARNKNRVDLETVS